MNLSNVSLQDLPLEILIEISKVHPWTACELSKTVRKVGLYSLENNVDRWFKKEENNETFILIKAAKEPYCKRLPHSWNDNPAEIDGTKWWYKKGMIHRDSDKPAVIFLDGTQYWYKEDKRHRDNDLPAVILSNGNRYWYKEGLLHRDDNPAVICSSTAQAWYREGERYG